MKKTNEHIKHTTVSKKTAAHEKKVSTGKLNDKDEKVQKHRATDIQKPVTNKE
jgi:hypothetical protein